MQVIVSDSSVLIDLDKARLMSRGLVGQYQFVIPDALYEEELIALVNYPKQELPKLGLRVEGLDPAQVQQAFAYQTRFPALTVQDCFALTLAKTTEQSLLLTGDNNLRKAAGHERVEVHGLIWACEQMNGYQTATARQIYNALKLLEQDPMVWLPKTPLQELLERLGNQL